MMDKIFDSFYTTKPGGMGMGLSISRSILQSHGGRLWATANDGPGTSFHFSLPKFHGEEQMPELREPNAAVRLWTTTPGSGRRAADPVKSVGAEDGSELCLYVSRAASRCRIPNARIPDGRLVPKPPRRDAGAPAGNRIDADVG